MHPQPIVIQSVLFWFLIVFMLNSLHKIQLKMFIPTAYLFEKGIIKAVLNSTIRIINQRVKGFFLWPLNVKLQSHFHSTF